MTEAEVGLRLDKALAQRPEIASRSQATGLINRGLVRFNGAETKSSHKLKLGEEFHIQIILRETTPIIPYDLKLDIVFEDKDLLVVNKPSGLVVHPAAGHYENTLVNALLHHTQKLSKGFAHDRPGIVHRIDKDTSGLLVVAKNDLALRSLAEQFKNKTTERLYWCVVYGTFKKLQGTFRSYLKRHPSQRKKFASEKLGAQSIPKGKLAITHYEVKKLSASGLSLVHCRLETGRTHQIRVHLSEAEHPIVADTVYCNAHRVKSVKSLAQRKHLMTAPHMILHAAELGFYHPRSRKKMNFKAPWPEELHQTLKSIGLYDF